MTANQSPSREAVARVEKYIAEYEDAPKWGGPTIYPAAPSVSDLRAILALLPPTPQQAIPDGWVMVPVKPSDVMLRAGWNQTPEVWRANFENLSEVWFAMLASAPKPTAESEPK